MLHHSRRCVRHVASLALALTLGCETTAPIPAIQGTWDIVGYVDHGVTATTTAGTATFLADSTFAMAGTLTFPSEPVDTFSVAGTYRQDGASVTLTTTDGSGTWRLTAQGPTVTLTLEGVAPPTRIILTRHAV